MTDAGDCYLLEVNTLPGMTAFSSAAGDRREGLESGSKSWWSGYCFSVIEDRA